MRGARINDVTINSNVFKLSDSACANNNTDVGNLASAEFIANKQNKMVSVSQLHALSSLFSALPMLFC